MTPKKKQRNVVYKVCGGVILAAVAFIAICSELESMKLMTKEQAAI
jgi:hypothetical protein